jgi:hypothetical protein
MDRRGFLKGGALAAFTAAALNQPAAEAGMREREFTSKMIN